MALKTWTNGNGTNLWSDPLNWSGGKPGGADEARFDATSVAKCTIDEVVSVDAITATAAYTGGGADDGKLENPGGYAVAVANDVTLDNKTFDMGTAIWTVTGNFDHLDVTTISAASGKLIMVGTGKTVALDTATLGELEITGTITFANPASGTNVIVTRISGTFTIPVGPNYATGGAGGELWVTGTGQLTGGGIFLSQSGDIKQNDGIIDVATLNLRNGGEVAAGTYDSAQVNFNGTVIGSVLVSFDGTVVFTGNVLFNMTGTGTVFIQNTTNDPNLVFEGDVDWNVAAGAITWNKGTGTITLSGAGSGTQTIELAPGQNVEPITINDAGATKQLIGSLECDGLSVQAGTTDFNGQNVDVHGDLVYAAGAQNTGSGLDGITLGVDGAIDLVGQVGTPLDFDAGAGYSFALNTYGAGQVVTYVDFGDCTATVEPVDATDGTNTDSGSNSEVYFAVVTRTWDGGGGGTAYHTAANWSGDTVPGPFDIALFDATSAKDCAVLAPNDVRVGEINCTAAYTGQFNGGGRAVDVYGAAFFANASLLLGNNGWRVGGLDISGVTSFTPSTATVDVYGDGGVLKTAVGQSIPTAFISGPVGGGPSVDTYFECDRIDIQTGELEVPSGDVLQTDDFRLLSGARIFGAGQLDVPDGGDVTQNDGTFDLATLLFLGGGSFADGTYNCSGGVTFYTNIVGTSNLIFDAGTIRIESGSTVFQADGAAVILSVDHNTNDPVIEFVEGNVQIAETAGGSVTWNRGVGSLTFINDTLTTYTVDLASKTVERLIFQGTVPATPTISTFQFIADVTTEGVRLFDGRVDFNGQTLDIDNDFDIVPPGQVYGVGLNGTTFNVGNDIDFAGTESVHLDLIATATWFLNVAISDGVSHVCAAYSDASGGITIRANLSHDLGNNTNWEFLSIEGSIDVGTEMPHIWNLNWAGDASFLESAAVLLGNVGVPRFITGEINPVAILTGTFGEGYLYNAIIEASADLIGTIRYVLGPGNDPESRARALGYRSSHVLIVHAIEATHPDDLTAANIQTGDSFLVSAAYVGSPGDPFFDAGAKAGSLGLIAEDDAAVQFYIFREPIKQEVVWYVQRGSLIDVSLYQWSSEAWVKYTSMPQRAFAAMRIFEQLDPDGVYDYYAKIMGSAYWEWSYDNEFLLNFIDPQKCPAEFLPELAKQFGLAVEFGEAEAVRRQRIELAVPEYKLKGLALSVFLRLRSIGYLGYSHEIYVDPDAADNWVSEVDAPTYVKDDIAARGLTGQIPTDSGEKGQDFIEVPHGYLSDEPVTYWPSSRVSVHINRSDGTPLLGLLAGDIDALKEEIARQLVSEVLPIHLDVRYYVTDAHVEDDQDTLTVGDELEALIDGYPYDEFDRGDGPVA